MQRAALADGEDDVEGGVTLGFGIVGDGLGDVAGLDVKLQRLLGEIGQASDFGFAVAVGADLQVSFAHVHEAVAKLDGDLGVVDGLAVPVADGEIGTAGSDAAVDFGDRRGWRGILSLGGRILG